MGTDKLKILVIDDNHDNLTVVKAVVTGAFPAAEIFTARDGAGGLRLALAENPDVILLDIVMPGMDGFDVCRQLKADARLTDIPVVFLTAIKAKNDVLLKALEAGGEGFLSKPFEEAELVAHIRAMAKIKTHNLTQRGEKERLAMLLKDRTEELAEKKDENMRTSAELAAAEGRYSALFASMSEGFALQEIICDGAGKPVDYRFLDVNPAFESITGQKRAAVLGRTVLEVWPATPKRLIEAYGRVALTREPLHTDEFAAVLGCKSLSITAFSPAAGQFAVIFSDVTGRKQAEDALKASEIKWRSLFQILPVGVSILDARDGLLDFNPALGKILGISEAGLLDGSYGRRKYLRADGTPLPVEEFPGERAIREQGVVAPFIIAAEKEDGGTIWTEVCAAPLSGTSAVVVTTDITAREENRAVLAAAELKYRNLFNNAGVGIVRSRLDSSEILDINDKALAIFGRTREEMVGTPSSNYWADKSERAKMVSLLKAKGRLEDFESTIVNKSGEARICLSTLIVYPERGVVEGSLVDITERKRAEAALSKLQRLSAESERIGKVGGWEINLDTGRATWTEEVYRIHELGQDFSPGMENAANFYTPETRPTLENAVKRAIEIGERFDLELEIITSKGNRRNVRAIGEADLKNRRLYGFFQDITERKQAEQKLLESEARFRMLIEDAPMGISLSRNGIGLYANKKLLQLLGLRNLEAYIGRPITQSFAPQCREESAERTRRRTLGLAVPYEYESVFVNASGSQFPVQINVSSIQLQDGIAHFGFVTDITERKLAEKERDEAIDRFERLALQSRTAPWETDAAGLYTYASSVFETLTGFSPADLVGKLHFYDIHPEEGRAAFKKAALEVFARRSVFKDLENPIKTREGGIVWVSTDGMPVVDAEGKLTGYRGSDRDITERKLAEQKLQESEARLKKAQTMARVGNWEVNLGTRAVWASEEARRIFGFEAEQELTLDLIKKPMSGRDMPVVARAFKRLADGGAGFDQELEITQLKTGAALWIHFAAEFKLEANGEVKISGVLQDITESRQAQQALRESELKYRNLFNNTGVSMFRTRQDGSEMLDLNDSYLKLLGRTREEALGKPSVDFWADPADRAKMVELFKTGDRVENMEFRLLRKNGEVRNCITSLNLYREQGILEGAILDITERKRTEEQLQAAKDLLQSIIDNTPALVYVLDAQERFVTANKALGNVLGLPSDWLLGKKRSELMPPDMAASHGENDRKIIESGRAQQFEESAMVKGEGRRTFLTLKFPLRNTIGAIVGVGGVSTDITGRKLAEEEKEQLNRELVEKSREMENFLYITTHDLRTPLLNIQGFSRSLAISLAELRELVLAGALPPEARAGALNIMDERAPVALEFITESVGKMDRLLTALLKVSRLGRVEMRSETVDMDAVLKNALDALAYQLERAGGQVNIGPLPPCKADTGIMGQLFSNLLDNAIKYRDRGRKLEITVRGERKGADRVLYTVSDNGPGIRAAELEKIWEVFYRGKTQHPQSGEGVGLPLVKRMAEKNGGRVWVRSKEGAGLDFFIEMPADGDAGK